MREESPRGAAWPRITSFDREFADLVDTLQKVSRSARKGQLFTEEFRKDFRLSGLCKDGLDKETLQDIDGEQTSLELDSRFVHKHGFAFHGSQRLTEEAPQSFEPGRLAVLDAGGGGNVPWEGSGFMVAINVNTAPIDGGAIVATSSSSSTWTTSEVRTAWDQGSSVQQPQGFSDLAPSVSTVSGGNAMWIDTSGSGPVFPSLPPILTSSGFSSPAAGRSNVAYGGSPRGGSGLSETHYGALGVQAPSNIVPTSTLADRIVLPPKVRSQTGISTASFSIAPASGVTVQPNTSGGLVITPIYDSTIQNDANAAKIEATIQAAINNIESYVSNSVTVSITFSETSSGLAQSNTNYYSTSYASYVTALQNNQTRTVNDNTAIASLGSGTSVNPVNGTTNIEATESLLEALGVNITQNGNAFGPLTVPLSGTVQLNTSLMNISRTGTQNPNLYDLEAAATHEMDEILGIGGAGSLLSQGTGGDVGVLDLYRYSGNGVRSFTAAAGPDPYFSINGGATNLVYFNQNYANDGSDFSDWGNGTTGAQAGNTPPNVQDAYGTPGAQDNLGKYEMTAFDVVGWNLTTAGLALEGIPEPRSMALLAGAAMTLFGFRRRRNGPAV